MNNVSHPITGAYTARTTLTRALSTAPYDFNKHQTWTNKLHLVTFERFHVSQCVQIAGKNFIVANGTGKVNFDVRIGGRWSSATMKNMWNRPLLEAHHLSFPFDKLLLVEMALHLWLWRYENPAWWLTYCERWSYRFMECAFALRKSSCKLTFCFISWCNAMFPRRTWVSQPISCSRVVVWRRYFVKSAQIPRHCVAVVRYLESRIANHSIHVVIALTS